MLAAVLILLFSLFVVFFIANYERRDNSEDEEEFRKTPQMKKLWSLAQTAMKERKPLKAEKVLLTILKFDEKNAAAYNRLGILYAREKHYKEAIECFEIAQSLDNNASSLHNVGLIYYETARYEQAAMAFSQAIELEGDQPGRYIAYAKALEKLGQRKQAVEQLEIAYSLNPTAVILRHILEIYEIIGDEEKIAETQKRIEDLQNTRARKEAQAAAAKKRAEDRRVAEAKLRAEKRAANAKAKADKNAARIAAKNAKIKQSANIKKIVK